MEYGLGKVEESVELWFSDNQTDHVKVSVKVEKQLFGEQTDFQRIDVFESREFGRFLSSDGSIVFSEKDEFIYDEMIVHVPMAVHPHVKKVLVIGGGDGGVARELSYYEEIEQIDVVNGQTAAFLVNKLFLRQAVQAARFASGVNNIQHEQLVVPLEQIEYVMGKSSAIQQGHIVRPGVAQKLPHGVHPHAVVRQQQIADSENKNLGHISSRTDVGLKQPGAQVLSFRWRGLGQSLGLPVRIKRPIIGGVYFHSKKA